MLAEFRVNSTQEFNLVPRMSDDMLNRLLILPIDFGIC